MTSNRRNQVSRLPWLRPLATVVIFALAGLASSQRIIELSIPVDSMDATCEARDSGVWSLAGNPVPTNVGIGWLLNPNPSNSNYVVHDHQYLQDNVPDPTRAIITFRFDQPVIVNSLTVVEHTNGITKLEGFSGPSLSEMSSVGNVFGDMGDITGHNLLPEYSQNRFAFNQGASGQYFQAVVRKTSLGYGYAAYRMHLNVSLLPVNYTFTLDKAIVAGQNSVLGSLVLANVRPNHTPFTITPSSTLVTAPPSVTVYRGLLVRNFQMKVAAVLSPVMTVITATNGTVARSQGLLLTPLVPTAMAFTPAQVIGGNDASCRLVINGVAGPGGRVISVFDSSAYATTPNSVTVPPGATQVTFLIATRPVTSIQTVSVTARVTAGEKTGTFRVYPISPQ